LLQWRRAPLSPVFKSALATQAEIWDAGGGIDDAHARLCPRCWSKPLCWAAFMTPAGCVGAILDGNAVLHAIETARVSPSGSWPIHDPPLRFGRKNDAHTISLLVTKARRGKRSTASLGMTLWDIIIVSIRAPDDQNTAHRLNLPPLDPLPDHRQVLWHL
jgi:hypothetical protein